MENRITPQTLVKDAVDSCPDAAAIFERHGVNPSASCKGMYNNITLEEAEDWCSIKDVKGLIEELNTALQKSEARTNSEAHT